MASRYAPAGGRSGHRRRPRRSDDTPTAPRTVPPAAPRNSHPGLPSGDTATGPEDPQAAVPAPVESRLSPEKPGTAIGPWSHDRGARAFHSTDEYVADR